MDWRTDATGNSTAMAYQRHHGEVLFAGTQKYQIKKQRASGTINEAIVLETLAKCANVSFGRVVQMRQLRYVASTSVGVDLSPGRASFQNVIVLMKILA